MADTRSASAKRAGRRAAKGLAISILLPASHDRSDSASFTGGERPFPGAADSRISLATARHRSQQLEIFGNHDSASARAYSSEAEAGSRQIKIQSAVSIPSNGCPAAYLPSNV